MKLITGILGCALAAGLMTFATDKAQAGGIVVSNALYSPFNIKITVQYKNSKGQVQKASFSSKDALKELGYNSNVQLAVTDETEVWVINTKAKTLNRDLGAGDFPVFSLSQSSVIYTELKDDQETEAGILNVVFNSDRTPFDRFDISGVFGWKGTGGKVNTTTGVYSYSTSLNASGLSGSGTFSGLGSDIPTTGSASYSGSGKLVDDDVLAN